MRKTPRRVWKVLSWGGRHTPFGGMTRLPSSLVLMYHNVSDRIPEYPGNIEPERLRKDLSNFKSRFDIVDLPEVLERPQEGRKVAVTFDDGIKNFQENALSIIEGLEIPVTNFVSPGRCGDLSVGVDRDDGSHPRYMTRDELEEVIESPFVTIGSHTRNHPILPDCTEEKKRKEIIGGKEDLEEWFDIDVDRFAYPVGRVDEVSAEIVKESHTYAVTTERRHVSPTDEPWLIPRIAADTPRPLLDWDISDVGRTLLPLFSRV